MPDASTERGSHRNIFEIIFIIIDIRTNLMPIFYILIFELDANYLYVIHSSKII